MNDAHPAASDETKAAEARRAALAAEALLSAPAVDEEDDGMDTWAIRALIDGTNDSLENAIMSPKDTVLKLRKHFNKVGDDSFWLFFKGRQLEDPHTLEHCGLYHGAVVTVQEKPPRLVATASADGVCHIWDVQTAEQLQTLAHDGPLTCVSFNHSGSHVLTASKDNTAKIWVTDTGKLQKTLEGHTGVVLSAEFNGKGDRVLTASGDGSAKVWDVDSGDCLFTMDESVKGHIMMISMATWSPDSELVMTVSHDSTAKLWSPTNKELLNTFVGHKSFVRCAEFAPVHGEWAITASSDKTCRIWDVYGSGLGEFIADLDEELESTRCAGTLEGHTGAVLATRVSHDGQKVLTASSDHTAKLWRIFEDGEFCGECELTLRGHSSLILACSLSPSGLALTASSDRTARIWSLENGECLHTLLGHAAGGVTCAAYSIDGDQVVTSSDDRTAKLWDAETGVCFGTIHGHEKTVSRVCFSPW